MSKHTKGPWQVRRKDQIYIIESQKSYLAETILKADARLIAAAPELLEALKLAFEMHKDTLSTHDERMKVMANAIGKAEDEGGQK